MNTIHILGRIARKEIKVAKKDNKDLKICDFTIASDRNYNTDAADFILCSAFNIQAAYLEKYAKVGQRIYVVGSLVVDNWEKDGEQKYKTYVRVSSVQNADKVVSDTENSFAYDEIDDDFPFN